jgi:signal transduction histidine kinase
MLSSYESLIAQLNELADRAGSGEAAAAIRAAHDIEQIQADMPGVLDAIEEGSRRAKAIVRDLRTFSQSDDVERRKADIRECLESTVRLVEGTVKGRIQFERQYEDGVAQIECYPRLLNQVFLNIIKNATEVLPEKGHIRVALRSTPGGVEVRIRDNGPGMPADVSERIFEPFFTTKPVGQGTGLGLAVSHGIITRHGGKIEVTCPDEGGTEFMIFLPDELPPEAAQGHPSAKPAFAA